MSSAVLLTAVLTAVCFIGTYVEAGDLRIELPPDIVTEKVCIDDRKQCPHGMGYVTRDPKNDCKFRPCPCPHEKLRYRCIRELVCESFESVISSISSIDSDDICYRNFARPYCDVDPCGGCKAVWYRVNGQNHQIDICGDGCPFGKPRQNNCTDLCAKEPPCLKSNPNATCEVDHCGECTAMWWVDYTKTNMLNCEIHDCPGEMIWSYCGSACPLTCDPPPQFCILPCLFKCVCPSHKPVYHNGKCIKRNQCPCPNGRIEFSTIDCESDFCHPPKICSNNNKCCVPSIYKAVCDILDHLKTDYLLGINLHKTIVSTLPGRLDKGPLRRLIDWLWRLLTRLNELICEVEMIKKRLQPPFSLELPESVPARSVVKRQADPTLSTDSYELVDFMMTSIGETLNLASEMQALAGDLAGFNLNATLVEALLNFVATCVHPASFNQVDLLVVIVNNEPARARIDAVTNMLTPAQRLCKKLDSLNDLMREFLDLYPYIDKLLRDIFKNNGAMKKFPIKMMYDLCACIFFNMRMTNKLLECCKDIRQVSHQEWAKKISEWLEEAMKTREEMRECLALVSAAKIKAAINKIPGSSIFNENKVWKKKKKVSKAAGSLVQKKIGDLLSRFDKCVQKMKCLYIEFVESWWNEEEFPFLWRG